MKKRRIDLIDLWRTVAVLTMVIYHFIYDMGVFGVISWDQVFSPGPQILQRVASYSFIVVSGVSSRLTKSNIKRGLLVLLCSVAVSAVSFVAGLPIMFGILQFLGCAMLIYGLAGSRLERIPERFAPFLYLALFIGAKIFVDTAPYVEQRFLWPFGFVYQGFSSSDYYPLLPWIFLFLFGSWLGGLITKKQKRWPVLGLSFPKALTLPGRYSLIIYMAHQPLLYGLCFLIF